jgi:hypothetical protein
MFQIISKSVLALAMVSSVVSFADEYRVSDRDLDSLRSSIESIDRDVQDILRRGRGPGGHGGLNRELQNISDKLSGRRGLLDWVSDMRRGGHSGGGGHGPGPAPKPTLLTVTGFFVVGKVDSRDAGEAGRSHSAECSRWETFLRGELGNTFDIFTCGNSTNVTQYPSLGYMQMSSKPQFTVIVPAGVTARSTPTADISGSVDAKDNNAAYDSWAVECMKVIKAEKVKYGARFIAASCGEPKNITKYPSLGYKQFYSTGTVYIQ